MTDKIIEAQFNEGQKMDEEFFGVPLHPSWHKVIIEGRRIPNLLVRKWDENVEVMFDDRLVYIFPDVPTARLACTLAANAMALASGYPWMGAPNKDMPFAPQVIELGA